MCGCRLRPDDVAALGGSARLQVNQRAYRWKAPVTSKRLCTGGVLSCLPLMEILDLSWNSGVGGGALQGSPLQGSPLRELHLASCQLTAADAALLGYHHYISHNPPTRTLFSYLCRLHCRVFVSQEESSLRSPDSACWTFPVTLCLDRKLAVPVLDSWRPPCLTPPPSIRCDCRPVV